MRVLDVVGSLFWLVVGLLFVVGSFEYRLLSSGLPGAGLFPFLAGILLIVLSMGVFISSLKSGSVVPAEKDGKKNFPKRDSWKKVSFSLAALMFYWIALEATGFIITTFSFMVFLLRLVEPQKWKTTLSASILTTAVCYIIFHIWLKVQLPKGIFGL